MAEIRHRRACFDMRAFAKNEPSPVNRNATCMNAVRPVGVWLPIMAMVGAFALAVPCTLAQSSGEIRILPSEGTIELSTDGGRRWLPTQTNQLLRVGDRLRTGVSTRTGTKTRVSLLWSGTKMLSFYGPSESEILAPQAADTQPGLHLVRGLVSLFHRDRQGHFRVTTAGAVAGVKGTEFVIEVDSVNGEPRTTLSVIDGIVEFGNERGTLTLRNAQRAVVEAGAAPRPIAGIVANNLLQWAFYYPGVLDLRDLVFSDEEEKALGESFAAYRAGDLLAALAAYGTREPKSEAERIYRAALLLSVGEVEQTAVALSQIEQTGASDRGRRLAAALRRLISAVKYESAATTNEPVLTTELLAASYYEQSRAGGDETLKRALIFATRAATFLMRSSFR